jgi:hypothetical protein
VIGLRLVRVNVLPIVLRWIGFGTFGESSGDKVAEPFGRPTALRFWFVASRLSLHSLSSAF